MSIDFLFRRDAEPYRGSRTMASLPAYRKWWKTGVNELKLKLLSDLLNLESVDVTVDNKAQVIDELNQLAEWVRQHAPSSTAVENDQRIQDVERAIREYVDEHCIDAWIG